MIEFDAVRRTFGSKVALEGLTLRIVPGEVFALLGPNGAGKTTAIRLLVGLLRPDSGSIRIRGIDLSRAQREAAERLGYIPDEVFLYEKLTGREFLEFVAELRGLDLRQAQAAIATQIRRFAMESFLDTLIETYSHGMRQRIVFAAALLHEPDVLVIDEPMVGLDPRSVRMVKDLLRRYAAAGRTVFMSTHTLAVAEEIADRIAILDQGRLRFLGTVEQLRRELAADESNLEALFLQLTDGHAGRQRAHVCPPPDRAADLGPQPAGPGDASAGE